MKIEVMMPVEAQHRESILAGTPTSETSGLTHIDGRKAAKAKSLTADVHQVSEENSNQMVAAREQQAAEW
jgi:predicted thioesterase